jgi:hypothetical protein
MNNKRKKKGDAGTKVKTPGAGRVIVGERCKLHHFPVQGPCLVSNTSAM